MNRVEVAEIIAEEATEDDLFVSSVGAIIDDWWNLRPGGADNTISLSILGSICSTALGLALALPHRRIIAIDTDGSALMNTGILCTLGNQRPRNLSVVVLDNGLYECIGSAQTLTAGHTDLARMAEGAGCLNTVTVLDTGSLRESLRAHLVDDEMGYIVAKIAPGMHVWPPDQRRYTDGVEDKYRFMRHVEKIEGRRMFGGALHV
jgi:Thiamine pyrophosphate-requiring enzymes [acetolactate synthase, pyruvate dehydrogenase (cytochrome), glyoxylate carboligase, phosphonopyruvate decarboxylase]